MVDKQRDALLRVGAACVACTGYANGWLAQRSGYQYRWLVTERVGNQDPDGAVRGVVERFDRRLGWRRAGTFVVDSDGLATRGPSWFRKAANNRTEEGTK